MSEETVKILVVDDRPENLVSIEEILRRPDRQILKAGSGNEALAMMLRHEVAVVVLDVQMPEMDGYETARLMRSDPRGRVVPIIFVTAGDRSDGATLHGYEAGAVDFLYKPINIVALRSKVEVFIQLHRNAVELRKLNAVLERTSQELQHRVADLESVNRTLSHDLRAPLRSIDGFTRILDETHRDRLDDDGKRHIDRICRACGRMGRMLDDLQRLLRINTQTEFELIECEQILAGVLEDLGADLQTTGAAVTHDPLPAVTANPTLIGLIMQNLVANALKFRAEAAPAIHVTADRKGPLWCFSFRDNGRGIAPEYREKVFGIFQRLTNDTVPGTGVGLALCRQAVERHGGTIWVESTPGEGSTFYFTLPAALAAS